MRGLVGLEAGLGGGPGSGYTLGFNQWILHLSLVFFGSRTSNISCLECVVVTAVAINGSWLGLRTLNLGFFNRFLELLLRWLPVIIDLRVVHAIPHVATEALLLDVGHLPFIKSLSRSLA